MLYKISFDPLIKDYTVFFEIFFQNCEDNSVISITEGNYFVSKKIHIKNKNNITVKGENAVLISEFNPKFGSAEYKGVLAFTDCSNIKIEGLIFESSAPINSAGRVIGIDLQNHSIDVKIYDDCILDGNQTIYAVNSMDKDGSPDYLMAGYGVMEYEVISNKSVRIYCDERLYSSLKRISIGTQLCFRYGVGGYNVLPNAMLTFYNCEDTILNDITIHSSPGYAIVVFPRCHNFTIKGYKLLCPNGSNRLMASNVDGIHILGLSGILKMKNCYFSGLGDDALNIHSTAGHIIKKEKNVITVQNKRFSIPLEDEWCRKGDKISVYGTDFIKKATLIVDSYEDSKIHYSIYDGVIAAGDFVANTNFYSEVEIENCEVRNSRARAFVFQTENIRVQGCKFYGISGAAILMSPDVERWQEVGPVKNVYIENCSFDKCGFSPLDSQKSAIVVRGSHDSNILYPSGVHKNINVVNNRFSNIPNEEIYISATDNLKIVDNISDGDKDKYYKTENCSNVFIK